MHGNERVLTSGASVLPDVSAMGKSFPAWRIFEPGRNCWRVEQADRAAVLIDGATYFARLEQALRRATRSILIIGWDFDASIKLRADDEDASQLGDLLRSIVEERPELEVRILVWSLSTLHGPSATLPLIFGADWQDHPRIELRLDDKHPLYASHHQKIVCIDESVAFAGGIDLTVERWDTTRHAAEEPARLCPDGSTYGPVHDVQLAVDSDAARAVCDLARERWRVATGETLSPRAGKEDIWPPDLEPEFTDTPVAIARTAPEWGEMKGAREAAALTLDALKAARHYVYIETQYLTAPEIRDLLAARLEEPDGPEIVIVVTRSTHGVLEHYIMGANRERVIRRLRKSDRFDRLRVYHPVVPSAEGDCEVLIHAKLIIADDAFLRVGSSNLNNRSIGLDTECDLAIAAFDDSSRRVIGRIRERLVSEHLGVGPEAVAEAVAAEDGSLVGAIDRLNTGARCLREFDEVKDDGPTRSFPGTRFLDPEEPLDSKDILPKKPG